jgi:hypothetical protein
MLAKFFITISQGIFVRTRAGFGRGAYAVVGGRRRVVAAYVSAGSMLAIFFITISHCPWRDFISLSNGDKETKQRKRLPTICFKCPQRADHCFWFPRRTVLVKPRTLEPLLLANSYIPTLRHQWSRARTMELRNVTASPLFEFDWSYSVRSELRRSFQARLLACRAGCATILGVLMVERMTEHSVAFELARDHWWRSVGM